MATAFEVMAKIALDTSAYEKNLDTAEKKSSKFASQLKTGLATSAKIGAAAIGAVTVAALALGRAMSKSIQETAAAGDRIDKMSQKMGLTAESFQEWDFVMQHCGTTIESLQTGMKTLATAAESGNKAFEQLGLSQEQIANMSQEELFSATITALQNVEDETQRTYLAGKLLGRGATELGALLNMSADETEGLKNQLHDLNCVMSDEAVRASAQYQDSLQNVKAAVSGVKYSLMAEFLPSLSTVMDGLAKVFSGDDSGLGLVESGLTEFTDSLSVQLPKAFNAIYSLLSTLLPTLVNSISSGLPTVLESVIGLVETLANAIVSNLPAIANAIVGALPLLANSVLRIVSSLAKTLGPAMKTMIPAITTAILDIVSIILDNLPEFVDAIFELVDGITEGVIEALPILFSRFPEIVSKTVNAFVKLLPRLIEEIIRALLEYQTELSMAGVELFVALTRLAPQITLELVNSLPDIIDGIIEGFSAYFSDFEDVGSDMLGYIGDGFKRILSAPLDWADGLVGNLLDGILTSIASSDFGKKIMSAIDSALEFIGIDPIFDKYLNPTSNGDFLSGIVGAVKGADKSTPRGRGQYVAVGAESESGSKTQKIDYSKQKREAQAYYSEVNKMSGNADLLGAKKAKEQSADIKKVYADGQKDANENGKKQGNKFGEGLRSAKPKVKNAAKALADAANSAMSGSNAYNVGSSFASAFASGISSASNSITQALINAVKNAISDVSGDNRNARSVSILKTNGNALESSGVVVNIGDVFINDVVPDDEGDIIEKVVREVGDVISRRMAVYGI